MRFTHPFVSGIADGADATLVQPSDWNDAHKMAATTDAKTASYSILDADNGKIVRAAHSASITFTLPAATGLSNDWAVWIANEQTGDDDAAELLIDPDGSDTIDGLSAGIPIYTWPGDLRLIRRTSATSWESILFRGGHIQVLTTGGVTLHWPSKATRMFRRMWGAGGGGASGSRGASGAARRGGAGGGGGAHVFDELPGDALSASTALTCTIGTGGAGGAARTTDGVGAIGTVGGNTSVAATGLTTIYAFGGGVGDTNQNGPTGGGWHSAQIVSGSTNYAVGQQAGTSNDGEEGFGGGRGGVFNTNGASTGVFGGGGGGCGSDSGAGAGGGKAWPSGPGGGAGGNLASTPVNTAGGDGGVAAQAASSTLFGGGSAGGAAGTNNGTAGTATPSAHGPQNAGGGGGSSTSANGGDGGDGGRCAGGGGGGATNTGTQSGAGGTGGHGLIRLAYT